MVLKEYVFILDKRADFSYFYWIAKVYVQYKSTKRKLQKIIGNT
jgi:hypothetical protein